VSGLGRIILLGATVATVAGIVSLRAQTQLADPKDAPKIFASTCSACHKSPQGLAKSGQVAGFLRQHYTTGPEMSAAMAAYLVSAGSAPAGKKSQEKGQATAAAPGGENPAAKAKTKRQEQAVLQPGGETPAIDAKERRTLRGKQQQQQQQQQAKAAGEPAPVHTAPVHAPAAAEPATRQAAAPAAAPSEPQPAAAPAGPPPVVLDIPLPELPTGPPADLTQSVFASSPVP